MATTQKWNNLATLITAKAEHKEKFNEIIEYKDYEDIYYYRTLKENIEEISINQETFINCLSSIIGQKYQKYITERKIETSGLCPEGTTIPKLDDITEYNPDECCPVCFEIFGIDDDDATIAEGQNCNHIICRECYEKIVDDTNRCPICRAVLDYDFEKPVETETETDTDESDEEDFNGNNRQPTDDLFNGRRWYNTEINQIQYWNTNNSGLVNGLNGLSGWSSYNPCVGAIENFVIRQNSWGGANHIDGCCNICGIQKTIEVNEWMMRRRVNNPNITQNGYIWNDDWNDAFDNDDRQECYECNYRYIQISDAFFVREN